MAICEALDALELAWAGPSVRLPAIAASERRLSMPMPVVSDYICDGELLPEERKKNRLLLSPQLHGVNLGGWLVLQPWITPSLFYQFENQPAAQTAMDMYTFCHVLGPVEGNRQLRDHWSQWVTEHDLQQLVQPGINTLRIPVGDWMFEPYAPFKGCTDGSMEELTRVLKSCNRMGLKVLVDLHGVRRSQNGFDNSGRASNVTWSAEGTHFSHWPIRSAGWQGTFDPMTLTYTSISWDNLRSTVTLLQKIALRLRAYPAVLGLEALNEPWQFTPLDVLKAFTWDSYWAVRAAAPKWLFVFHDAFRFDEWHGFMKGCPAVALDTHVFQAWFDIRTQASFLANACSWRPRIRAVQASTVPVIVGEWSLATDNCQMWLNGFHDNAPGYPKVECDWMVCPEPYVRGIRGPPKQSNAPGPFGTGFSAPINGHCPISKPWDNEAKVLPRLAQHKLSAFQEAAGWFYWNFKIEMQAQWSWQASIDRGWLPANLSQLPLGYLDVCHGSSDVDYADGGAGGDLPWYNALPKPRGSSPVILLMGVGLATLLCAAVLLKMVLNILVRSTAKPTRSSAASGASGAGAGAGGGGSGGSFGRVSAIAQPGNPLELPPRLLNIARKSQGRKPGGLGALGLKQRVSSRTLTALAFPLMRQHNAIKEAPDEEAFDVPTHSLLSRSAAAAAAAAALLTGAGAPSRTPSADLLATGCNIVARTRGSTKSTNNLNLGDGLSAGAASGNILCVERQENHERRQTGTCNQRGLLNDERRPGCLPGLWL